jgi:hypothetical protein
MEKEITCTQLWRSWQFRHPKNPLIIEANSRMSKYTKTDWENMVLDAKETIEEISNLIVNNIDINDPLSEKAALRLANHVSKYFFEFSKEYAVGIKFDINNSGDYFKFFNQFHEGMAEKIVELVDSYSDNF